jgi:hypothetical protein
VISLYGPQDFVGDTTRVGNGHATGGSQA